MKTYIIITFYQWFPNIHKWCLSVPTNIIDNFMPMRLNKIPFETITPNIIHRIKETLETDSNIIIVKLQEYFYLQLSYRKKILHPRKFTTPKWSFKWNLNIHFVQANLRLQLCQEILLSIPLSSICLIAYCFNMLSLIISLLCRVRNRRIKSTPLTPFFTASLIPLLLGHYCHCN